MPFLAKIETHTGGGDELALERRLEAEFGAEAAVAPVIDEDVVRAERREAHAARVTALRLHSSLQRGAAQFGRKVKQQGWNDILGRKLCIWYKLRQVGARLGNKLQKSSRINTLKFLLQFLKNQ